jgi:PAS domain S-box-containing protein
MIVDINPFLIDMLGYSHDAFLKKYIWDVGLFKDIIANKDNFFELQKKGYIRYEDLQLETFDGKGKHVEFVSNVYTVNDKKVIQCNIRDITERFLADKERRSSETNFRTVAELSPLAIYASSGSDQKAIYINESFYNMFGYSKADVPTVGYWWIKAFPDEKYRQQVMNQWQYNIEKADKSNMNVEKLECVCTCKDGSEKDINWIGKTNGDEFWAFGHDITERKKEEESLKVQKNIGDIFLKTSGEDMFNEVLKVILEVMQSPFGVFGYIDENGSNVVPTMTRQIWDKCNIPEKSIVFPRETWGDSSWPTAIREKKSNYSNEISNKTPAGHVTVTRYISVPILFTDEVIGLFQVANKETDYSKADVHKLETIAGYVAPILKTRLQKQLFDEKIIKLNAELEQRVVERTAQFETANKELESFSYSISHDLRAPLRHIGGFVGLLIEENSSQLDGKGLKYLNTISTASVEMGNLIDSLLIFSRLSKAEVKQTKINSRNLLNRVIKTFSDEIKCRNVEINLSELPDINGDEDLISQVWVNLISNALKYSRNKEKAVIEIGGKTENGETVFYIKDNGAGFDMKYADKLFGVFQRLHKTREFEGIGIGLANVNRIVMRHKGKCHAEGEVGKGATFFFSIPNN